MKIVAIAHKYDDGSVSLSSLNLTDAEELEIQTILDRHANEGCSVRGNADEIRLSEVV